MNLFVSPGRAAGLDLRHGPQGERLEIRLPIFSQADADQLPTALDDTW